MYNWYDIRSVLNKELYGNWLMVNKRKICEKDDFNITINGSLDQKINIKE